MPTGTGNSPHTASILILDDDSLLDIFSLYRPAFLDGDEDSIDRLIGGREWIRERWWYKLTHVCQRWRNLILGSASYLGVCLVCTFGTPVADMLSHSPPLPLIVDYDDEHDALTAEDEQAIVLALGYRHRVRRIRLAMPFPNLQKLIVAMDEGYPVLEYLVVGPSKQYSTALTFPGTLQAPHLRHITLLGFDNPIGSRLFTTAVGLVTLCLIITHPPAYLQPDTLLQWISFMPQLEVLTIFFVFTVPNRDVLHGVSAYLEALVRRTTAPRLKTVEIDFFKQITFSVPCLLEIMNMTESFRFNIAEFQFFDDNVDMKVYPHTRSTTYAFSIVVYSQHLDQQVSSVATIFNSSSQVFSAVEHLTLKRQVQVRSFEERNETDGTEWREFLRSFSHVKTLDVDDGLVKGVSRCLQLDDGGLLLVLLPELQELTYPESSDTDDIFTSFIDARRNAGRPVTLTHR